MHDFKLIDTREGMLGFVGDIDKLRLLIEFRKQYAEDRERLIELIENLKTRKERRIEKRELNHHHPRLHRWVLAHGLVQLREDGSIAIPMKDGIFMREPLRGAARIMKSGDVTSSVREIKFQEVPDYCIPPQDAVCTRCGKGWSMSNLLDVVARKSFRNVHLNEFAGRRYADAICIIERRGKVSLFAQYLSDTKGVCREFGLKDFLPPRITGFFDFVWYMHHGCHSKRAALSPTPVDSRRVIAI